LRINDLVRLGCEPRTLRRLDEYVIESARGRSVLNVGAAGGVSSYLPENAAQWMHKKLQDVAAELAGVDIDSEAISHAAKHGYLIQYENCETMELDKQYDLILMSDVIEHVECPSKALVNLCRHLAPGGRLLVTTPNATSLNIISKALLRRAPNIFWDHMAIFLPEHLQAICDRHGLKLTEVRFFTFPDSRTLANRIKSGILGLSGKFNPRLHTTFLAGISRSGDAVRATEA